MGHTQVYTIDIKIQKSREDQSIKSCPHSQLLVEVCTVLLVVVEVIPNCTAVLMLEGQAVMGGEDSGAGGAGEEGEGGEREREGRRSREGRRGQGREGRRSGEGGRDGEGGMEREGEQ